MSLTVKYYDFPDGAQADAQVEVTGGQSISSPERIADGAADVPYATLEKGVWKLDGTRELVDLDTGSFLCWYSKNCSDETGRFAEPPVIVLSFTVPYTATGLTFFFSASTEQWCSHIKISWYNGQTLLVEAEVYPDSPHFTLDQVVESFDQIRIELLATNKPVNYAKIQKIQIGQELWFGKDELVSVQLLNEMDPTLCELTVDVMTVAVQNKLGRNLVPQQNQCMELYRDDALMATQYITGSRRDSKRYYEFSCQSAVGLLEDTCLGGFYSGVPLTDLLDEVLGDRPYTLHSTFAEKTVSGYLPICTRREALQQIAFAVGAVISTQRSRTIDLKPLADGAIATGTFTASEIFSGAGIESAPRLAYVQVAAHSYKQAQEAVTLLDGEDVSGMDVLFTFSEPHHSYSITGGTLTGSGANYVTITAEGTVTLTAKGYTHTTRTITKRNPSATAQERSNYLLVDGITLLNDSNASQALDRLYAASLFRQVLHQDAVISRDQQAGQVVVSPDPWGSKMRGYILSMDSTLTQGKQAATLKIAGVEEPLRAVCYYSGELYAGEEGGHIDGVGHGPY